MTSIQQEARQIRASDQFDRYTFSAVVQVDGPNGATYYVNVLKRTCTCPDYSRRCTSDGTEPGGVCKHVLMVEQWMEPMAFCDCGTVVPAAEARVSRHALGKVRCAGCRERDRKPYLTQRPRISPEQFKADWPD